jgi:hypothetical protein
MSTPQQSAGDGYAEWDAAYVLGALSPAERAEFEGHLGSCARCQAAVSEIAGLPGLLSSLGPEDAARLTDPRPAEDTPPVDLVPTVLATARRQRRRSRTRLLAVAAALVLVLAGTLLGRGLVGPGSDGSRRLAFEAVAASEITAVVDLVPVSGGTAVDVECQYAATEVGPEYSVVVADRSGHRLVVKDWSVKPGKVNRPHGQTTLRMSQIDAVEIREAATGTLVLRAPVR